MPRPWRMLVILNLLALSVTLAYAQNNNEAKSQVNEFLRYYKLDTKATPQEVERLIDLQVKLRSPATSVADRQAGYLELLQILYRMLGTTPLPPEQAVNGAARNFAQTAHGQLTSGPYKSPSDATTPSGQPGHVEKLGRGPIPMILLADVGEDWTLYKSFMERNASRYTMYAVTLPGSGGTPLPPKPQFYEPGATPWWDNVAQIVIKLIEKQKLDKPVVVGTQASSYAAARMAIAHPDKVRAAVLLNGMIKIPYRSLSDQQKLAGPEERRVILSTRPTTMGIIGDFGPQVVQTREALEQMIKNAPEPQRQFMLYSNLRDAERGKARFIASALNTDPRSFHYSMELNGVDLSDGLKTLKTPILSIVTIHDDNSPAQGGFAPSQWHEVKLRYPTIPVTVARFENTRGYIVEEAPQELDNAVAAFLAAKPVEGKTGNTLASRPSPRATASQVIGAAEIVVTYGRPRVNNRKVWGELVPYNGVWRAGANEATTIAFSSDVLIEGRKLPAGRYNFFAIPTENEWTIIFNKVIDQWGHFYYNQEFDALRVKVKPQSSVTGEHQEWLSYNFDLTSPTATQMVIHWEKLKAPIKIEVEAPNTP